MTVYRVGNVYYNEESIQQYIDQNYSFADFISVGLEDSSGNIRGMLNTICNVWNSNNQNDVVNYLNALNYMYVGYVNNMLSKLPRFTVLEGGKKDQGESPSDTVELVSDPVMPQSEVSQDE